MKSFLGIGFNFFKSVKSSDQDTNQNHLYAEANIIFKEVQYDITNAGALAKGVKVGELELTITKESAESIRDSMIEIIESFKKLEVNDKI